MDSGLSSYPSNSFENVENLKSEKDDRSAAEGVGDDSLFAAQGVKVENSTFEKDDSLSTAESIGDNSKSKDDSLFAAQGVKVENSMFEKDDSLSTAESIGDNSKSKDDSLFAAQGVKVENSTFEKDDSLSTAESIGNNSKSKDDGLSAAQSVNGENSKAIKDESLSAPQVVNGESSNSSQDYSSLIGAVVTQQMIQEEKALEEKVIQEEKELKAKIMEEQKKELEEVCYKRLNLLLNRSSLYAEFMADKLKRDKLKETKKQLRNEKRKIKSQSEEPRKRQKESPEKRRIRAVQEEEEEEDNGNICDSTSTEIENISNGQPSLITGGVMHPYQVEGFEWLKVIFENGVNGILADEMGLGKTIQSIAFIAYLIEMGVCGPFFICGPLSTVPNWYAEFQRFTPSIPVFIYHGDAHARAELRKKINRKIKNGKVVSCPVFITSYQIALNDSKFLKNYTWKLLVIDEAHRIKNFQCKLVTALKLFQTMHRLLLTGTPLQNDLSELWSLLNFILPEIFDDLKVFESWFDVSRLEAGVTNEIIAKEQEKQIVSKIHQILAPFLLRRTKAEVQLKLPEKKEVIVHAPLTKLQQEYYTAVLNKTIESTLGVKLDETVPEKRHTKVDFSLIYKMLEEGKMEQIPSLLNQINSVSKDVKNVFADVKLNIRNTTMILRKVCNHPYLLSYPIDPATEEYKIDEELIKNSGKFLVLDAMLPELKKRGHKILMFSQFVTMLEILQDYCWYRKYNYCLLYGKMSLEERKNEIEKFNTSDDIFIFLISTKAGGLGLNLAAADTVIIYDSDWNPQGDLQAQDRCHRIGQTKPVIVYRIIVPNSVDERIVNRANAKRKLEKVIIKKGRFNSNQFSASQKVSIEELLELLQSSDFSGFVKTDDNCIFSPEKLSELLDRSDMGIV